MIWGIPICVESFCNIKWYLILEATQMFMVLMNTFVLWCCRWPRPWWRCSCARVSHRYDCPWQWSPPGVPRSGPWVHCCQVRNREGCDQKFFTYECGRIFVKSSMIIIICIRFVDNVEWWIVFSFDGVWFVLFFYTLRLRSGMSLMGN